MSPALTTSPTSTGSGPASRGVLAATRKRILIVDDDPLVLQALARLFRSLEADVDATADPERGLELFCEGPYDLVIADERMPKMSGLDLLARVRAVDPRLPTILLTGHATPDSFTRAYERCGVFRYLTKPWDNLDLVGTVRDAFRAAAALG